MSCVAVRQCEPCGISTCSRCVGVESRPCCIQSPALPRLYTARPRPADTSTYFSSSGLGVGFDGDRIRHIAGGASGLAQRWNEHDIISVRFAGNDGSGHSRRIANGTDPQPVAATATAAEAEQLWWIHATAYEDEMLTATDHSDGPVPESDTDGIGWRDGRSRSSSTSSGEGFSEHLLQLATAGFDGRLSLGSSEDGSGSSDSTDEAAAVQFEEFHAPELLDGLSSEEEEEGAEALRLAELQAFVSMLTTPEEEFR
jgi:hypothetical protein